MGLSRGSHSFFECSYANRYVIEVDLFGPMNMSNLCNVNSRAKAFFSSALSILSAIIFCIIVGTAVTKGIFNKSIF